MHGAFDPTMPVLIPDSVRKACVLVVDDEQENVSSLTRLLARLGCEHILSTTEPRESIELTRKADPDLVILDLRMPEFDGFQVMRSLRPLTPPSGYRPILVMTGDLDRAVRDRALASGATDFLTKPFDASEAGLRIQNLLQTRHLHTRLAAENDELEERVRERTRDLEVAKSEILQRLAIAAEFRDDVTGRHAERVGVLAGLIAGELGCDPVERALIRAAAPLHDIGKIGIPDSILLKEGRLTEAEFEVMKGHTGIGAEILSGGAFPVLNTAAVIAAHHHERWDGTGYSKGLRGEEIPLVARIVTVADVYDSLSQRRPYKRPLASEECMQYIAAGDGSQFDPNVVSAFLALFRSGAVQKALATNADSGEIEERVAYQRPVVAPPRIESKDVDVCEQERPHAIPPSEKIAACAEESVESTRVLLVDDDADVRASLARTLVRWGFAVCEASDGFEAEIQARVLPPDLVITDILMPGRDGISTIQDLRIMHPTVKILAISGGGRIDASESLTDAALLGADATLAKPFSLDALSGAISGLLGGSRNGPVSRTDLKGHREIGSYQDRMRGG